MRVTRTFHVTVGPIVLVNGVWRLPLHGPPLGAVHALTLVVWLGLAWVVCDDKKMFSTLLISTFWAVAIASVLHVWWP